MPSFQVYTVKSLFKNALECSFLYFHFNIFAKEQNSSTPSYCCIFNGKWVYWDQLDAHCLVLFYYTFFTLHISDVIYIHPQERHIMHMQSDTGNCTCELTRSTPCLASNFQQYASSWSQ